MLWPTVSRPVYFDAKHPSEAYDQIFVTVRQLRVCCCGALSVTRERVCRLQLLLALASAVILGPESRGTRDHILLSHHKLYFVPLITPRHGRRRKHFSLLLYFSCCRGNMFVCEAVTQQRLLHTRLFQGRCPATGPHATILSISYLHDQVLGNWPSLSENGCLLFLFSFKTTSEILAFEMTVAETRGPTSVILYVGEYCIPRVYWSLGLHYYPLHIRCWFVGFFFRYEGGWCHSVAMMIVNIKSVSLTATSWSASGTVFSVK
jgi:hypothetical protein